jgi:hypothetical protein
MSMVSDREWLSRLYKRYGWTWWRSRRFKGFDIQKKSGERIFVKSSDIESFCRSSLNLTPSAEEKEE